MTAKQITRSVRKAQKAIKLARIACLNANADAEVYSSSNGLKIQTRILRDLVTAIGSLAFDALMQARRTELGIQPASRVARSRRDA